MERPFNPAEVARRAQERGLSQEAAAIFSSIAQEELQRLQAADPDIPVSTLELAERLKAVALESRDDNSEAAAAPEAAERNQIDEYNNLLRNDPNIKVVTEHIRGGTYKKFQFSEAMINGYFHGKDPYKKASSTDETKPWEHPWDLIHAICCNIQLAVELGKHLRPEDVLNLYIASRSFNRAIKGYMMSSVRAWVDHRCPEAGRIFPHQLYLPLLTPDPAGRTWADHFLGREVPADFNFNMADTRFVPGIKYLHLVLGRDRCCREIIAIMARCGHLMPKTMYSTLLRMWLLMDVSTTSQRMAVLRNRELWTDRDLYNAQLFFIKLGLHFNDPVFGPSSYQLMHLMLGQRAGLYPLWQLLMRKRFTRLPEVLELKVRYDYPLMGLAESRIPPGKDPHLHGVPLAEVGCMHREGWGEGHLHLMRPDELVPVEAVTRGLKLDAHIRHMILWGYFDWNTGENLVPTEEDMYISEEEEGALAHMDTTTHWRKRHAMKKRWDTLSPEQQQAIMDDDEDERIRALAWCYPDTDEEDEIEYGTDADDEEQEEEEDNETDGNEDEDGNDDGNEDEDGSNASDENAPRSYNVEPPAHEEDPFADDPPYSLDDEITRGFIVPEQAPDHQSTVPGVEDKVGWTNFVNRCLIGLVAEPSEDEVLRSQAWWSNSNAENHDDIADARWAVPAHFQVQNAGADADIEDEDEGGSESDDEDEGEDDSEDEDDEMGDWPDDDDLINVANQHLDFLLNL